MEKGTEMGRVQEGIRTRNKLADTLLELSETKNPNNIKVVELCRAADVDRHTFYHHFKDLYDLAEFTYDREVLKVLKANSIFGSIVLEDPREHVTRVLDALSDTSNGLKRLLFFYASRNQHGHFFDLVQCNIINGNRDRLSKANYDKETIDMMVELRSISISSVVISWLRGEIPMTSSELADYLMSVSEALIGALVKNAPEAEGTATGASRPEAIAVS
jgi:AcrR family transcriptional regulator